MDGSEYFFQNVASDYWLGGGNSWMTQVSVINYPQNFKAVKVSEGVYKFDSHQYNNANDHFLNTGFLDSGGCNWSVIAVGDGTYYLKSADNKYASLGEKPGAAAAFLDAPTDNSKWRIYSYDAVAARMETATADAPVKITELIQANTFKRNTITSHYSPWKRTGFDGTGSPANSAVGNENHSCAESYHSSNGFKFAQTIKQCVISGVYKLDAQAFYRQDGGNQNLPYFGVKDYKTYFPPKTGDEGSMDAAYASFLEKKYTVDPLYFAIGEDETEYTIEIAGNSNSMWHIWGELELSYIGNGADAFQLVLNKFLNSKPDYSAIEYRTDAIYADYEWALQDHAVATTYEELQDAKTAINGAEEALIENVAAWKDLIEARDDAVNNVVNNEKIVGEDKDNLGDYITQTINGTVVSEKSASTEELAEYTAEIKRLQAIAIENGMMEGTDCTNLLKNPNMSDASLWNVKDPTTGWVVEGNSSGGEWMIKADAKCAQCWNGSAYDVYQVVSGAPIGVYEISLQGFYRPSREAKSYGFYYNSDGSKKEEPDFGDWKENKSYIYMNDAQTLLDNVWNYGQSEELGNLTYDTTVPLSSNGPYPVVIGEETTWYCNNMTDAGKAFDQGAYKVSAYGLVAEKGDVMRLGIKGNNYNADNWTIFTRFRLTYQRFNETVMTDFLNSEIAKAEASLSQLFGYDKRQALNEALTEAKAAKEKTGEEMFAALKALVAIEKELTASIAKFDTLQTKKADLDEAITNYAEIATEEAVEAASTFYEEALENTLPPAIKAEIVTITDAQAGEYIKKIDELIDDLKIPADPGSDDQPADYTSMIKNNNYADKQEGWTCVNIEGNNNYNYDAAEYYQGVYSHYQDIKNLPAGTYMVSNQGFYRWANQQEDFDSVRAEVPSLASMYAMVFTENNAAADSIVCPVRHLAAEGVSANPDIDGQTSKDLFGKEYDDTRWYVPNSMLSFNSWIKTRKNDYVNQIVIKVAEGQTLRIGMSQSKSVGGGWAIFTNWALTAYGPESTKEEGAKTSSYADYKPALDEDRATVRKPLNDLIVVADSVYKAMEEGEAKEALELAITDAKAVYNGTTETPSTSYSNGDVVAATSALQDALGGGLKGDANNDGRVSIADVTTIAAYLLGNTPESFSPENADANGDGRISIADVTTVATMLLNEE